MRPLLLQVLIRDLTLGLHPPGTCLSIGVPQLMGSPGWSAVGAREEPSVAALHCGGGDMEGSVAAPGSRSGL